MSICPITKEECIKEGCSWWYKETHIETNKCIIPLLKFHLSQAIGEIQYLKEIYNELVDIGNKLRN